MKRLFVSDVDNTLLDENVTDFSELFINTVKKLTDSGDQFVLCSGRPTFNLICLAKELRERGVIIKYVGGYNGVEVYDTIKEQVIIDNGLEMEQVEAICKYLDAHNFDYMVYGHDQLKTTIPDHPLVIRELGFTGTVHGDLDTLCASPKVLVVNKPEDNDRALEQIQRDLTDYEVFTSMNVYVEIVKKGINKGSALKQIASIEQIPLANTYGFGDGGNDIELLQVAGCGVAVGNGSDAVKAVADVVIGPIEDDSVAKYLSDLDLEQ